MPGEDLSASVAHGHCSANSRSVDRKTGPRFERKGTFCVRNGRLCIPETGLGCDLTQYVSIVAADRTDSADGRAVEFMIGYIDDCRTVFRQYSSSDGSNRAKGSANIDVFTRLNSRVRNLRVF